MARSRRSTGARAAAQSGATSWSRGSRGTRRGQRGPGPVLVAPFGSGCAPGSCPWVPLWADCGDSGGLVGLVFEHQFEQEVGAVTALAMVGEGADTCPSPDLRAAVLAVTEAAGGARTWSASGRAGLIGELDRAITVLTSVRADLLIAERDGGGWKHAGDPSFEAWRARTSRSGMGAAFREVRCADALVAMPEMRRAAELGQVSVEHVDVVAKVAATGSAPVRQALASAQGQTEVLGLARRLDAGRFTRSMVLWAATLDSVAL